MSHHPPMHPIDASPDASIPVAAITGASSGIGYAIARRMLADGYACVLHGNRQFERLTALNREISAQPILCLQQDFRKHDHLHRFVAQAFDWQGRIDVWIHAAGADVLTANREASFESKLRELLDVDVIATILICRWVAERMLAQEKTNRIPSIVTIGWDQAVAGMEGDSGQMFSAVKSAVACFSLSLAKTFGPNVRVNCIAPGWIKTAWGSQASETWTRRAIGESCLNRWGTPEDVANLVGFLASPEAEFLNAQILNLNGGWKPSS